METFYLKVLTDNLGGYFSSEQLDLLTIIQCQTYDELISFVEQCQQLRGLFSQEDFQAFFNQDFSYLKHHIFELYQNSLVAHNSDKITVLDNLLAHLNITLEDKEIIKKLYNDKDSKRMIGFYIRNRYPDTYLDIFKMVLRFISVERDQNKSPNLYQELEILNERLGDFDTLLIGSGRPEIIINDFLEGTERFDFYFAQRDLDFALRNNKQVRFHSLLTKEVAETLFKGKTKEEILAIMKDYVKAAIDFITQYNATHRLRDGSGVIKAVDLFNEIISFDPNLDGEYENIWESNYGISIEDIWEVFKYAQEHKLQEVSYLYNEPFLEDTIRRKKVLETLSLINVKSGGLIDTLGSQMHITFTTSEAQIRECFADLALFQEKQGVKVQITEFDLSLSERETLKVIGNNPQVSYEQVYNMKKAKIDRISTIINSSKVKLSGVSYWSLTDEIDCNLERVRSNLLKKGIISDINQVPSVGGGLIPTYYQYGNVRSSENRTI